MENIMNEIEDIIEKLQLAIEDGDITKENLEDDIKSLLEEKVVELIANEIIEIG